MQLITGEVGYCKGYRKVQVITWGARYCFIVRVQVVTGGASYLKGQLITGGAGNLKGAGCDKGCRLP